MESEFIEYVMFFLVLFEEGEYLFILLFFGEVKFENICELYLFKNEYVVFLGDFMILRF